MANKLRAYGYARVSVDEEGDNSASIASQIAAIEAHCERNSIKLINILSSRGDRAPAVPFGARINALFQDS